MIHMGSFRDYGVSRCSYAQSSCWKSCFWCNEFFRYEFEF